MAEFDLIPILAALSPTARTPSEVEPLHGGQSRVRLFRLRYPWGDAILKGPLQPREALFYQDVAPRLSDEGVAVPIIYEHVVVEDGQWLLRESFPQVLPMARWVGDSAVMETLRRLHQIPRDFAISQPFIPSWQPLGEHNRVDLPNETVALLAHLAAQHANLFAPTCVIAGDPNATNWGIRADGTVVLFDWDRVGYGIPAHDVAVVMPQLGWPTFYQQVAAAYLGQDAESDEVIHFTHAMALAKVQVLVDYMNAPEIVEDSRQFVLSQFPSWLAMIGQWDRQYHAWYE